MKPDSASSTPEIRRGSGTRRSTEKTAAASVEASDGAHEEGDLQVHAEQDVRRHRDDEHRHATPTVDSTAAGATDRLMPDHRVVMPPSTRMRTRAE